VPLQRALDLLAVAQFGLVVVAIARFRQIFYQPWVWYLLLCIRIVFTIDLGYRASRFASPKFFLRVCNTSTESDEHSIPLKEGSPVPRPCLPPNRAPTTS
jgi:hypothetical protein